jgi:hypothetical protein
VGPAEGPHKKTREGRYCETTDEHKPAVVLSGKVMENPSGLPHRGRRNVAPSEWKTLRVYHRYLEGKEGVALRSFGRDVVMENPSGLHTLPCSTHFDYALTKKGSKLHFAYR